jgi:hypothetical protein
VSEELDREYVINGDDLRIALGEMKVMVNPADTAAYIVGKYAAPLGAPVDAHICCEHADTDQELAAMAALLPAVPLLRRLSYDARVRVIEWYGHRVNDGQAPF